MTDTTKNDEPTTRRLPAPFEHIEVEYPYEWPGYLDPVSLFDTRYGNGRLMEAAYLRAIAATIEPTTPTREQIVDIINDRDKYRAVNTILALLSQPSPSIPSAEPPRIEDMAPGTTFTASYGKYLAWTTRWMRCIGPSRCVSVGGGRFDAYAIDPSTITNVTPPPALPNQEDA